MTTLTTDRLILRPLGQPGDAQAVAVHLSNWDVTRMLALPPWPYRLVDALEFVGRMARRPADDPALTLALALRHSPEGVEQPIGIADIAAVGGRPILGYWLAEPWWGQGLMTEALTAMIGHAFSTRTYDTICSGVFHDNPASLAVQRKLGFFVTGESVVQCMPRNLPVRHIDTQLTRAAFSAAIAESTIR